MKQSSVNASQASQHSRVHLIVLTVTLVDDANVACVGDDNVVPEAVQQTAHPWRMGSRFERDTASRHVLKLCESAFCRADYALGKDLSFGVQNAVSAALIAE